MRFYIFCILLATSDPIEASDSSLPSYNAGYYVDGDYTVVSICGPHILSGDWRKDTKNLGEFSFFSIPYLPVANIPSCYLTPQNQSYFLNIDCRGEFVQKLAYNSSNCTGNYSDTVYITGTACDFGPSSVSSNFATIACEKSSLFNVSDLKTYYRLELLTGTERDIQLVASTIPIPNASSVASSTFSGAYSVETYVFIYTDGCYGSEKHNRSYRGTIDCATRVLNFTSFDTRADCTGPSTIVNGPFYVNNFVSGFCLDSPSLPSSTSWSPTWGIIIGVPVGVGGLLLILITIYVVKYRK